jgi:hypothetical protein
MQFHYHKLLCRCLKKCKLHATVKLIRSLKKSPGDILIIAHLAAVKGIVLKDVARYEFIQAVSIADPSLGEAVEATLVEGGGTVNSDIVESLVTSQKAFKEEISDAVKNLISIKNTGAADITTRKPLKRTKSVGKDAKGVLRTGKTTAKSLNLAIPNTKTKTIITKTPRVNLSAYTFEDADDYESRPTSSSAMEDVAELAGSVRKNRRGQRARQQYHRIFFN